MFYFKRTVGLLLGAGAVLAFSATSYGIDAPRKSQLEVQEVKTDSRDVQASLTVNLSSLPATETQKQSGSITVYTSEEMDAIENPIVQPVVPAGTLLLDAARSQIGIFQDCTAMVENSLRSLGHQVGDIGPMNFGVYGTQVDPATAQPGDIMMRWGHVAIYSGNNMAVHGGYNGVTLETDGAISNPYNYAVIIRIG